MSNSKSQALFLWGKGYRTISRNLCHLARVDSPDWQIIANTEDPDLYRRAYTWDRIKVPLTVCRHVPTSSDAIVGYVSHADCPVRRVVADMLVNGKKELHVFEMDVSNTQKTVKFGHRCLRGSNQKTSVYTFPYKISGSHYHRDQRINWQLEEKGLPIRIKGLNLVDVKPY